MTFLRNKTIWYAFYKKFAIFSDFENILVFFSKRTINFPKQLQILLVLRILKQYYHLRCIPKKIATFGDFEKVEGFFIKKTSTTPIKTQILNVSEKSDNFNCILWRICSNLVEKNHFHKTSVQKGI